MTGTTPHIAAANAASRKITELTALLEAKSKRRATIARDQSAAVHTIKKLEAQIQADGVAAVLAGIPYDQPAEVVHALRKATDKSEPCRAALAVLDNEIVGLRSDLDAAARARTLAKFGYSSALQSEYAEAVKASLLELLPQLATLLAVDTFRGRHATGAMSGVPVGGERPWQSTAVIINFLKSLPAQLRPAELTLATIQRAALSHVTTIEAALNKEQDQ